MSMANQKFDFGEADALKTKLGQGISQIEDDLKQMMGQVEGVKSWWAGGSEDAFIDNFRGTKDHIVKSLNEYLEDYNRLIESIKKAKSESDAAIASQLRG
ncbi:MAG: WXG100 family type VII secretion target [Eubacteriales bacterium]